VTYCHFANVFSRHADSVPDSHRSCHSYRYHHPYLENHLYYSKNPQTPALVITDCGNRGVTNCKSCAVKSENANFGSFNRN
jgi:hypothetical protein